MDILQLVDLHHRVRKIATYVNVINQVKRLLMRVISRPVIINFGLKYPGAVIPLNDWYQKIYKARCDNFNELREIFRSCDYIGDYRYAFNIGGNNYRLIGMIHFKAQKVYIRAILTHREYDEHNRRGTLILL